MLIYALNTWSGRGMEAVSMWHCWGTIEPSARLYCWIDCFLSFSWKSHRFHTGNQACWLANQAQYYKGQHLEVVLALWAGAKLFLEKEINISINLVSRWMHKVLKNLLVDGCIDFGLDKTQWTNTSRRHGTPNYLWFWKLHTGLQVAWIPCLSLAQVRCFWLCFCFRSGLVALFLKMSERGDSWCTDSSFSSLLVKLSQVFESGLIDSILKLAIIPVACPPFPAQCLPSSQLWI